MSLTAIIDCDSGNLHSALKAFERMAADLPGARVVLTPDPETVARADRIVLPGDGAFAACRRALDAIPGMEAALNEAVIARGRPFLGICIGMQLLATTGHEHGVTPGLGWIPGEVVALRPADPALKVPHMGWNDLRIARPHPVLDGIATGDHAYFVHSWHMLPADPAHLLATADHGGPVTAVIGRDTILGTQFHPEKSQATGLRLIGNFLRWAP
ncbi:MAG: imidazole glycerol phosphate synthase subunit HisH [Rubellimicrobium sp.]|nr:imidazole glycerol phosphate synthase subunit HisH [Rubellimicrobium sp.]